MSDNSFNAFQMAQTQFDNVAEQLNLDTATKELLRQSLCENIISAFRSGWMTAASGYFADSAFSTTMRAVPPKAASGSIRRRPSTRSAPFGHVDDLEMRRGRHSAGRRQGRRDLRSAQSERPRAGSDLPRLGPPGRQECRPARRRSRAGRHDQRPAHALDAG